MLTPEERQRIADEERYRIELRVEARSKLWKKWRRKFWIVLICTNVAAAAVTLAVFLYSRYTDSGPDPRKHQLVGLKLKVWGHVLSSGLRNASGNTYVFVEGVDRNVHCYTEQRFRNGASVVATGTVTEWTDKYGGTLNPCVVEAQ